MKKYVFYRMPTGRPYKGNDDKFAPTNILKFLGETSKANPDGIASWQNLKVMDYFTALRSMFVLLDPDGQELNGSDSWGIVNDALRQVLRNSIGKPASVAALLEQANREAAAFFQKPVANFVLVTSLSVEQLPANRIVADSCQITGLRMRGSRYRLPKVLEFHRHGAAFAEHLQSTKYQLVKVTTHGRTHQDAVENALSAVNLVRGLWSLFDTFGSWSFHGGIPQRKPLGVIHLGPVHTLHNLDGTPATEEMYWYDPHFSHDQPLFKNNERWIKIEKNRRNAMRTLRTLPHRRDVVALIERYAEALDQLNPDIAFLQMWGILEKLTDTVGANYDETIKRVLWIYLNEERPMLKEMLESIRNYRNQYVHAAKGNVDPDQTAYLIKSFVDPHLLRLIFNSFKVNSVEQYAEVLALPTDIAVLEQRIRRLSRALRGKKRANAK